jgi:hypothetical protein
MGTVLCLVVPSTATAVSYGLGDFGLDAYGDSSSFHTLCGWNGSSCGHGGLNTRYTRLTVPYNALGTYDSATGSCVDTSRDPKNWVWHNSVQVPTGQSLYSWLGEAEKDGLQPIFAITWGNRNLTGETDNPSYPTAKGYLCGLEALMHAAGPGWHRWVHEWEDFNEPEQGLCSSDAANFASQAVRAAAQEGRSSDTLVAGSFSSGDDPLDGSNHPDCGHPSGDWFIHDYAGAIKAKGLNPSVWSWHPYGDVNASYAGINNAHQTGDLAYYLNQQFPSHPSFWLTEAGVVLNMGRYGPYIDGSKTAQAYAARGFKNLGNAPNQAYSGQISRVYWYEYQTYGDGVSTGSDTWDSALLGITRADWVEDGSGVPRSSYCVLAYGDSPTQAASDTRCNYASSPDVPWTDWQDPHG